MIEVGVSVRILEYTPSPKSEQDISVSDFDFSPSLFGALPLAP
jgi:hypothetical protein